MMTTTVANGAPGDTTQTTTETRRARGPAISSQWWKAWILLSGLGATVAGWMLLPGVEPPSGGVVASKAVTTRSAEVIALPVSMRTMPEKPVFQAPVTRTRRS